MKNTAVKRITAVVLALVMAVVLSCNAFADTIQDKLEQRLEDLVNQYNSADTETQQSLQEQFNQFLEENNLQDFDLGSLGDTDIANIIKDLGNNLALDDFLALAQEAWASGTDMIKDVLSGGLGTANGSNTATTNALETQPTNVIIAGTAPQTPTSAIGIIATVESTTSEATTYDVGATTAAGIVGAGVTTGTTSAAVIEDDGGMSTSSVAVLVVLSISTIAVIVAIVIFFILKRK